MDVHVANVAYDVMDKWMPQLHKPLLKSPKTKSRWNNTNKKSHKGKVVDKYVGKHITYLLSEPELRDMHVLLRYRV